MSRTRKPYHHGNLRRALIDAALDVIAERGVESLSLRELATQAGVSHAAPAHHVGDKAGLLTAIAEEGFALLADALEAARPEGFKALGIAYVRFATSHHAHFAVMYDPSLYRADEAGVVAARDRAAALLYTAAGDRDRGLAGWCLMHGLATLWLAGALPRSATKSRSPTTLADRVARTAFRGGKSSR